MIGAAVTAPLALGADAIDYLCVDRFVGGYVEAGALRTAFELGLIDALAQRGPLPLPELAETAGADPEGLRFLVDLLAGVGVLATRGIVVTLTPAFAHALRYRELMEARIEFAAWLAADFAGLLTALIAHPDRFMRQARLFKLFDYGRCFDATRENLAHTRRWMRLTTALTRHEAPVCFDLVDLTSHRRMLDVGGNSGEFAIQACRRHPALQAAVADLPVVCEVGLEHVLHADERSRVGFHPLDLRRDDLPRGYDLVSFKSMLHDWPLDDALEFLDKGAEAVAPGGTILIFERGPLDVRQATPAYGALPVAMFFRSYRSPQAYVQRLAARGFADFRCMEVRLDTPFFIVTARKAAP